MISYTMNKLEDKLRDIAKGYVGKPYRCSRPQMACIFLVLDILAPVSEEFSAIRGRLKCLEITAAKRTLIRQDYFFKFIRTTGLNLLPMAESIRQSLQPGDVLLINKVQADGRVDHLGLYLGRDEVILLNRTPQGYMADMLHINELQNNIKAVARGRLDG